MIIEPPELLTPGAYLSLSRKLLEDPGDRRPLRLSLLSSNSFEFLEPYIVVECARRGLAAAPVCGAFGQLEQAILDESSSTVSSDTDVVVIALRIEDVFSDAYLQADSGSLHEASVQCIDRLSQCVDLVRARSDARIVVANFSRPSDAASANVFGAGFVDGSSHIVASANAELAKRVADKPDVCIWDYEGLVASRGVSQWTDPRLWYLARQPISGANLPFAAAHLARTLAGTLFARAKCLVLDLDNTLWGGAAGDDGIEGIDIGDDYPGSVFKQFQRAVAGLSRRGVLLAIASKNDEAPVREIFEKHPDLVLRWNDFSSHRVNWDTKSENLEAIAKELNIGLEALVLFDDNPVEREEVRINAPGVQVVDVPTSPLGYVGALFESGFFDSPEHSAEDAERASYYRHEVRRSADRHAAASMEDFLASLDMQAAVGEVGPETITRVAQLVGKTNQFNLTTRRHNQARLQQMAEDDAWEVRWMRLRDRYGDSGLIGVTIVHYDEQLATIDSFLMSCRVMNRRVEQAMLRNIVENAISRGCRSLRGEYLATDRNAVVKDFFAKNGFSAVGEPAVFEVKLDEGDGLPEWPQVIGR